MKHHGRCALCGTEGELKKSHVDLPRFVHKRLRSKDRPNPNPVQVTFDEVRQTPKQEWRHLLCAVCENSRFNERGERWVANHCLQPNGTFPLLAMLRQRVHSSKTASLAYFPTAHLPAVNHAALTYFAASMLWRSQYNISNKPIDLGPYEKGLKAFLLDQSTFPENITVVIAMRYRSIVTQVSHAVVGNRYGLAHYYSFAIPGLKFFFSVGKNATEGSISGCFIRNPNHLLFDVDAVDETLKEGLDKVMKGLDRRGIPIMLPGL